MMDCEIREGRVMTRTFRIWRREEDNELTLHYCVDKDLCLRQHAHIPMTAYEITNNFCEMHDV